MILSRLTAENLTNRFGKSLLWKIDYLELQAGECVHLRGENGSGKTTLLKILAGLQRPSAGRVLINAAPVELGKQVCYLHQQPYMFDRSVRANLQLVLAAQSGTQGDKRQRLQQALEWSGLAAQADQSARTLSGGERQALAMARAWLCRPMFWLLDEPIASLDEKGVARCVTLVNQLRQSGAGILLITHQQGLLTELCDRQWTLHQGQLLTTADRHQEDSIVC
ncbi:MAG: ATP-binding cassette domain-containing protein [Nitrincola lacisaponensis]|uniref:ABC-type tungstate transport system, ATP-binding protein n=1 Tax=Nitrincola lacisaponensis TaxID=267850 RepID=A0A063XY70_9GAMM|nr:ABC transporter ATP-binding protein [Nitrincola lacisaponensis]KDE39088.1 ABC-type tungstate transport system, ATP-binding protein [Nitrincola lacisaponensis]